MNLIRLSDLRTYLAEYVGGGVDADDARVLKRINECEERLIVKDTWHNTICAVTFCIHYGYITLPRDIQKILKARINGEAVNVWSQWYEFLGNGPGLLEDTSFYNFDPIDRGFAPTQYDIPEGPTAYNLLVVAEKEEEADSTIFIQGFDETGQEVSENITLRYRAPYYSHYFYQKIKSIQKPVTNGYIYLSTWDPDTSVRFHLATYHPDETVPSYRRFAIGELACCEADRSCLSQESYRLDAIVKRCHVPLSHDTDIPVIQNLAAFKMMSKAIDFEDASDTDSADKWEAKAERILSEQLDDVQTKSLELDVQLEGFDQGYNIGLV